MILWNHQITTNESKSDRRKRRMKKFMTAVMTMGMVAALTACSLEGPGSSSTSVADTTAKTGTAESDSGTTVQENGKTIFSYR